MVGPSDGHQSPRSGRGLDCGTVEVHAVHMKSTTAGALQVRAREHSHVVREIDTKCSVEGEDGLHFRINQTADTVDLATGPLAVKLNAPGDEDNFQHALPTPKPA